MFLKTPCEGDGGLSKIQTPRYINWLFSPRKIIIIGNRCRPVGEYSQNTDILGQHIEHFVHISIVTNRIGDGLVIPPDSCCQWTGTLQGPGNNIETGFFRSFGIFGRYDFSVFLVLKI